MVNMHALRYVTEAYGGYSLHTPYHEGFKNTLYCFGSVGKGCLEPSDAVLRIQSGISPFSAEADEEALSTEPDLVGRPFTQSRIAFQDSMHHFSPDDFSTLQRNIREECEAPSIRHALALLRLSNHDSDVFYKFKQTFIEHIIQAPAETTQRDVRGDTDRVYASYYPLQLSKDIHFELGRLLMGLRVS